MSAENNTNMNEIIYLEPDEDITGVISRVKETTSKAVCLVIPRGGTISQSVINLKLIKREIEKLDKVISLVTKDKISKNLASQVGITVYPSANEAKNARIVIKEAVREKDNETKSSIKINRYSREESESQEEEKDNMAEADLSQTDDSDSESNDTTEEEVAADDLSSNTEIERSMMAHARPMPKKAIANSDKKENQVADDTKKKNLSSRKKPAIIIASIMLVLILSGVAVFLPSAEIDVTLATTDAEFTSEVIADKSITSSDTEKMMLPLKGYEVTKEMQKEITATGKKDVGTKASGEITFYNDYDPQNAVIIPSGTTLTASGKSFITESVITIPPATVVSLYPQKINPGTVKGTIVAKESGDSYNIAAAKFVIPAFSGVKQEKVYGQSTAALTGGTTKEITIVGQNDIDNGKKTLDEELDTAIKAEISASATTDSVKLVTSSIEKSEISFTTSKNVDEETDKFTIKIGIKITEMGFSESDMQNLVLLKSKGMLNDDEMYVNPDPTQISYDIASVDNENGQIKINTKFSGKKGKKIDGSIIQNLLVRSKYGSAESRIEAVDGVSDAKIVISPKSWPMLPILKQRIKVNFDYQKE